MLNSTPQDDQPPFIERTASGKRVECVTLLRTEQRLRFPQYFVCHQMHFMQPAFPDFVPPSDRDTEPAIDSRVLNAGGFDYKRL